MTIGSMCTGYGGIDLALEALGHTTTWVAEVDPAASKSGRSALAAHPEPRRHQGRRLGHSTARRHRHRRLSLPTILARREAAR
jgi:hypothetical protein